MLFGVASDGSVWFIGTVLGLEDRDSYATEVRVNATFRHWRRSRVTYYHHHRSPITAIVCPD